MVYKRYTRFLFSIPLLITLTSCSFNPFWADNDLTGSGAATAVGAGAGAGAAALVGASQSEIGFGALVGGVVGYYVSTLRFAAGGVMHVGGQVYNIGDYVTIEVPTDRLFEVNTAEFTDEATPILDSIVAVLKRTPDNSIMISGNTTGFYTRCFESKLSEDRARQVSAYLWAHGINNFRNPGIGQRTLRYVGYGNFFPISSDRTNKGIRENSRIQITSYPCDAELHSQGSHSHYHNIGALDDPPLTPATYKKTSSSNPFSANEY